MQGRRGRQGADGSSSRGAVWASGAQGAAQQTAAQQWWEGRRQPSCFPHAAPSLLPAGLAGYPDPHGDQAQAEVDTAGLCTHVHRLTLEHSTCSPNACGHNLMAPASHPATSLDKYATGGRGAWCYLPKTSAPSPPPEPVGHSVHAQALLPAFLVQHKGIQVCVGGHVSSPPSLLSPRAPGALPLL